MDNRQKNVMERVRKLLALSESSNENEAKAALQKAYTLLAKHKLNMQDIENKENLVKVIKKNTEIVYTRRKGFWKYLLIKSITDNYCVGIFF